MKGGIKKGNVIYYLLVLKVQGLPWGQVVKTWPSNAGDIDWIPDHGAKIPRASRLKYLNIKQKQYCIKFHKDLKIVQIKKKNLGSPKIT